MQVNSVTYFHLGFCRISFKCRARLSWSCFFYAKFVLSRCLNWLSLLACMHEIYLPLLMLTPCCRRFNEYKELEWWKLISTCGCWLLISCSCVSTILEILKEFQVAGDWAGMKSKIVRDPLNYFAPLKSCLHRCSRPTCVDDVGHLQALCWLDAHVWPEVLPTLPSCRPSRTHTPTIAGQRFDPDRTPSCWPGSDPSSHYE